MTNAWFTRRQSRSQPSLLLLCFPYAGKGSTIYLRWGDHLAASVEVLPIHLPGRELRAKEPATTRLIPLTNAIADAIAPALDRPFAVFGHSMGSVLAFEVLRRLASVHDKHAVHLFASGRAAPRVARRPPGLHRLPDAELVDALHKSYGGIPDVVRKDAALLQHFIPVLRADLALLETYKYAPAAKLRCPVTAFGGRADPHTNEADLQAWADETTSTFRFRMFDGDHFFLNSKREELLREIRADLEVHTANTARLPMAAASPSGSPASSAASRGAGLSSRSSAPLSVLVFPGQGSQRLGMGAGLFDRYSRLVAEADEILGYSLRSLCLEDPRRELSQTKYTQPALFVVNALTYLARVDSGRLPADAVAGHSLGEYNALFAAGVFDFGSGVRLVKRRGELMSEAKDGTMAAVIGLDRETLAQALDSAGLNAVDIANLNAPTQTVIAGTKDDIASAEPVLTRRGARFVVLNVSAAFHSRHMAPAQRMFEEYLRGFRFAAPQITVIANVSARPYPADEAAIRSTLAKQITNSVRWSESISYLLAQGEVQFEELGPGDVLSRLVAEVRKAPLPLVATPEFASPEPAIERRVPSPSARLAEIRPTITRAPLLPTRGGVAFLYNGQGSQYFSMGAAFYESDAAFRRAFDHCSAIAQSRLGTSLVDATFRSGKPFEPFDRILYSNPALFAFGYALTMALDARGVRPDMVLGYGVGEYVAHVTAGTLTVEDGLALTIEQARLLESHAPTAAMLSVFAEPAIVTRQRALFAGCEVANVSFSRHFVISGHPADVEAAARQLKELEVVTFPLPLRYGLHTRWVDAIGPEFRRFAQGVRYRSPQLPLFSPTKCAWLSEPDAEDIWNACRMPFDFSSVVNELESRAVERYVDVGPSGTLATFVKHQLGDGSRTMTLLSRFASDPGSLDTAERAVRGAVERRTRKPGVSGHRAIPHEVRHVRSDHDERF